MQSVAPTSLTAYLNLPNFLIHLTLFLHLLPALQPQFERSQVYLLVLFVIHQLQVLCSFGGLLLRDDWGRALEGIGGLLLGGLVV